MSEHQKPFVLWVQRWDVVFEGDNRQDCIDQMLAVDAKTTPIFQFTKLSSSDTTAAQMERYLTEVTA